MIKLILILFYLTNIKSDNPTSVYVNKIVLVEPDIYTLYWNYTKNDIVFETHVKTNGWSGFGLSNNGGMKESNVVVSWLNSNGLANFSDRYVTLERDVMINPVQSWFLLESTSINGYLITKFTRKIKLCDKSLKHIDIETGTPFVIFAWGEEIVNNDISYHKSNRGAKVVALISSFNNIVKLNASQIETLEYHTNVG